MAQCEGTTKAGARCKRTAPEGERFCSIHAGQEQPDVRDRPKKEEREKESRRTRFPGSRHMETPEDILHVAVGVLATVALFWLIRRGPKLPGF